MASNRRSQRIDSHGGDQVIDIVEYDDQSNTFNRSSTIRYRPTGAPTQRMIKSGDFDGDRHTDYDQHSVYIPTRRRSGPELTRDIARRSALPARTDVDRAVVVSSRKPKSIMGKHPLIYIGAGMVGMLVLYNAAIGIVAAATTSLDDMKYGRPRESHTSYVVGHNDSALHPSQFICSNIDSKISVIEMPGGDLSHARSYMVVGLVNQPLVPCTIDFTSGTGSAGSSMIVTVGNEEFFFDNNGKTFKERGN